MNDQICQEPGPAETIVRFERNSEEVVTSRSLFDYADALRQVGRRQQALRMYQKLYALPVAESKVWLVSLYIGETLYEMGKFSEAEMSFREACDHDTTTVPRIYLAGSLAAQERFEEALLVLSEALSREGDRDEVWLNIALNQRTLGDLQGAERSLVEALTITPDYPAALVALVDVRNAISVEASADSPHSPPHGSNRRP